MRFGWVLSARVASGYDALLKGNPAVALQHFGRFCDPQATRKLFLHWHWRQYGRLGAVEARLMSGDLANAHRATEEFYAAALALPCPNLRALAWHGRSRLAALEGDYETAQSCLTRALAIVDHSRSP
jgi:tetratricopeptide (TPR) repeat protein